MATKITMDSKESQIYVFKAKSNTSLNVANTYKIDSTSKIPFSKYNIKETDMRVKTATFTSPIYVDLTQNKWFVRIASPYHENFGGIILSVEKDEDSGMYDYQCQDYSRNYQSKDKLINTTCSYYEVLQKLIVGSMQSGPLSRTQKQTYSYTLSGLQPISKYRQKVLPNLSYQNPLKKVNKFVMEGSAIEKIRNICYQEGSAIDVYFDQNGIINHFACGEFVDDFGKIFVNFHNDGRICAGERIFYFVEFGGRGNYRQDVVAESDGSSDLRRDCQKRGHARYRHDFCSARLKQSKNVNVRAVKHRVADCREADVSPAAQQI